MPQTRSTSVFVRQHRAASIQPPGRRRVTALRIRPRMNGVPDRRRDSPSDQVRRRGREGRGGRDKIAEVREEGPCRSQEARPAQHGARPTRTERSAERPERQTGKATDKPQRRRARRRVHRRPRAGRGRYRGTPPSVAADADALQTGDGLRQPRVRAQAPARPGRGTAPESG